MEGLGNEKVLELFWAGDPDAATELEQRGYVYDEVGDTWSKDGDVYRAAAE